MLAAYADLGRVDLHADKSIEQALVIFPALMSALITLAGGVPYEGGKLDFKVDLGDPPYSTGTAAHHPATADQTVRPARRTCTAKSPQNDPCAVRGPGTPCQEFPG